VDRRPINDAVVATLLAGTTKPVALAKVPDVLVVDDDGRLVEPYAIVYAIPGTTTRRTISDADGDWLYEYQVTSVGARDDQAQAMADLCRRALVERAPNGDFITPMVLAAGQIIDRRSLEAGGPEPAGGGLWQVIDTYHLEASR
jgi:hypothetical protein